jgi:hypothetical protein
LEKKADSQQTEQDDACRKVKRIDKGEKRTLRDMDGNGSTLI